MTADEMHSMAVGALEIRTHLQRRVREDMARIATIEAWLCAVDAKMKNIGPVSQPLASVEAPAPLSP